MRVEAERDPERERVRAVLRERARALARPPAPPPPADALEVLTFGLARASCAVESRFVHAVFRTTELTPLPGAAAPVVGVTGWRGEVLTLLDLRAALGMTAGDPGELGRVIVLGGARPAFGVLAHELHEVVKLQASELVEPAEPSASGLVRGVTRAGLVLLDAERLLALQAERKPT